MEKELASLKENNVNDLIPRKAVQAAWKVIGSPNIIMLDVKTAFLQSPIDTPTYVRQPHGYEKMDAQGKPMIMNLKQAVYGLRTASRVWHLTLDKALQDIGFKATKTDPCMYISEIEGGVLHVDNFRR